MLIQAILEYSGPMQQRASDITKPREWDPPVREQAETLRFGAFNGLLWGLLGFFIGAIFWHFIGFWAFISEIVFVGRNAGDARFVEQAGQLCVQLVLERPAGVVRPEACPLEAEPLNEGALSVRSDFAGDRGAKSLDGRDPLRLSAGPR